MGEKLGREGVHRVSHAASPGDFAIFLRAPRDNVRPRHYNQMTWGDGFAHEQDYLFPRGLTSFGILCLAPPSRAHLTTMT
jgi:hypothetical protein